MQKNDKFYTFLLSHKTQSKLYIRRLEISKKILHRSIIGLILTISFTVLGFTNIYKNSSIAKSETTNPTALIAQQISQNPNNYSAEYKSINYSAPAKSENFTINSGGPITSIDMDMDTEPVIEESEMENRMRVIQTTSNPAFLPTIWAHLGKINNEYGFRRNPFGGRSYEFHAGMDIDGNKGDSVLAPANGIVTKAGWHGGYGNLIEIDHGNGLTTRYGHLSQGNVQVGDAVQRGQLIGLIGSTGRSTGPHLHYELRMNDKPINPRRLLPSEPFELKKIS
ncbi:MAG TPA: M23 family metallopeptidase [Pyrinomonadaceae bacterium]|jgi:murein DD-endopeptidase MepM/ murein hydrolase activator NlpD